MEVNLETEGEYQFCQTAQKKQGDRGELGNYLAHAYECSAPMQMHCTTAFLGNCWHCNRGKPEPHVDGHSAHGCRPLLLRKFLITGWVLAPVMRMSLRAMRG